MPKIQVLDDQIARKIAAGEVVERPASVVKELVENAIDAGSTHITVEIREGGITYLRVTDNGSGIPKEEVETAFLRHATSKLQTAEQLFDIHQMGFRGEALYSIAAVARVEMDTKPRDQEMGMQIEIEGGKVMRCSEHGCPDGTTVIVRDLFFNTPARLKFLSKPSTEASSISAILSKLILARPDISVKYISNGRTVYHSTGDGDLRNAVFAIYGKDTASHLIRVHGTNGPCEVDGFIGMPEQVRTSRGHQTLFVNHRPIAHIPFSRAVEDGYGGILGSGKYPIFVLNLSVPANRVDVNVHPNKLQVRFLEEQELRLLVYRAVADAVGRRLDTPAVIHSFAAAPVKAPAATPKVTYGAGNFTTPQAAAPRVQARPAADDTLHGEEKKEPVTPQALPVQKTAEDRMHSSPSVNTSVQHTVHTPQEKPSHAIESFVQRVRQAARQADPVERAFGTKAPLQQEMTLYSSDYAGAAPQPRQTKAVPPPVSTPSAAPSAAAEPMATEPAPQQLEVLPQKEAPLPQVIGVAFQTYIMLQSDDALYIIDQHAAHERLLYERYAAMLQAQEVVAQPLLLPQNLDVTHDEQILLEENLPLLAELGFDLEYFGRLSYTIRAVPVLLGDPAPRELLQAMLRSLQGGKPADAVTLKKERLMSMACRHAIKAGDTLSEGDIRALMQLIVQEKTPLSCPHGRPIVLVMEKNVLEKHFKRIK